MTCETCRSKDEGDGAILVAMDSGNLSVAKHYIVQRKTIGCHHAQLEEKVAGLTAALEEEQRRECVNGCEYEADLSDRPGSHTDACKEMRRALDDARPILARVRAEAKAEALRKAGDWFSGISGPVNTRDALYRMADKAAELWRKE